MAITIQNHTKTIASRVVGTFVEDKPVLAGFSGFFPRETALTRQLDLEVQRNNDTIAVDVRRFTEGNKINLVSLLKRNLSLHILERNTIFKMMKFICLRLR